MEPEGEPAVCPVCTVFEPQAWRKSLCRNCFKTFEQHGEEGLDSDAVDSEGQQDNAAHHALDAKSSASKDSTQKASAKEPAQKPAEKSSSAFSSSPSSSKPSSCPAAPGSKLSSSKSSASTTSTTTTTATTSSSSSSSSSSKASKAKDMASKFEDKGSKGKQSSSTTTTTTTTSPSSKSSITSTTSTSKTSSSTTSPTSSSKPSSTSPATNSKLGTEKKVSSKTDTAASKRGSTESKSTPSNNSRSPGSESKSRTTTAAAGTEKKPLASSSPSKTEGVKEKEKDNQVSPPSPSLSDTGARAKWDKRSSGGGGGGGSVGGKTDVTKGQKSAGEVKGSRGESANGGSGVGKSRLAELSGARITGKETADTADSSSSSSASPFTAKRSPSDKAPSSPSAVKPRSVDVPGSKGSPKFSSSGRTSSSTSSTPPASPSTPKHDASSSAASSGGKATSTLSARTDNGRKGAAAQQESLKDSNNKAAKLLEEKEKVLKELEEKTQTLEKELSEKDQQLRKKLAAKDAELQTLKEVKEQKEKELKDLQKRLTDVEKEAREVRQQGQAARSTSSTSSTQDQRQQWEKGLLELRTQVSAMEEQCSKLERDNQSLLSKLKAQETQAHQVEEAQQRGHDHLSQVSGLQGDLKTSELEVEDLRSENVELHQELKDLRREMEEMYDTFRENEMDEFRELQRELDLTTKNCRVLQFKLRKAERRADQVETDRQHYEEKLHILQKQFESGDARSHIQALEEELRTAKEVSVRLHDELDLMEDRRNKALEDNRHLSELLEQMDKKQFRMEMETDKLRDQISDLKQQLREKSPSRKEGTPDRRDVLGRQGSQEYDSAQLMRDLCDSVERETDLKEQLRFLEEESRMLRKKLAEMEDENEALRVQLKKLSVKASRWKEESEGRAGAGPRKAEDTALERERLDSSDDETSVVTLKLQMALLEQELMTSQRGQAEAEKEAENLKGEVTSLERKLKEQEQEAASRREELAPPAPDAYYEEKVRELTQVADELRWRIIEKDREIERLSTASIAHARHHGHGHGHHGHGGGSRGEAGRRSGLKKSKSLDSDPVVEDLRRQVESSQHEVTALRNQMTMAREQREAAEKEILTLRHQLQQQQQQQQQQQPSPHVDHEKLTPHAPPSPLAASSVPSVQADDAALQNIELRDALKRGEAEQRALREHVRTLTEQLHALSRRSSSNSSGGAASSTTTTTTTTPTTPTTLYHSPRLPPLTAAGTAPSAAITSSSPPPSSPSSILPPLSTTTTTTTTTSFTPTPPPLPPPPPPSSTSPSSPSPSSPSLSSQPKIPHVPTSPDAAVVVLAATTDEDASGGLAVNSVAARTSQAVSRQERGHSRFELEDVSPGPPLPSVPPSTMAERVEGGGAKRGEPTQAPEVVETGVQGLLQQEKRRGEEREGAEVKQAGGVGAGAGAGASDVMVVVVATPSLERRVVRVAEGESRESLMDKILDLEEELNDVLLVVKRLKEEQDAKSREISSLRSELQDTQDVARRTELQLLKELDMLHDKNSVLSNLLDIIQERADTAEQELERHLQEHSAPSTRSASAVSQVSALSDASCGSDEVFLVPPAGAPTEKGQIIHRDWEAKLKNRIESLERLLAEERQKVSTVEKKLHLSGEHSLTPSLSDDVKLRLREKELLQEELLENQRHLRVATDQIQGMRERLHALEDEHHRLKVDYGKLCLELDKRELDSDQTEEDSDKTPENSVEPEGSLVALRAARLKAAATPSATNDDDPSTRTDTARDVTTEGVARSPDDVTALVHEVARYKLKSEQLEYKVEEISDIWRSKSAATEKEKQALEQQLKDKLAESARMSDHLDSFRTQLERQAEALSRAEEKVHQHEEEVNRRQAAEHELHELLSHATDRENSLRQLRETVATRDERLKEKDDIIHYLNSQLEQRQLETQQLQRRIDDMTSGSPLQAGIPAPPGKEMGETDVEKENARLRERARVLRMDLEHRDATHLELEASRQELERTSLSQARETAELQAALNVAEEKLRLYETLSTTATDKALENIKKESLTYFAEKEALTAEVTMVKHELSMCQQNARETTARLKQEVHSKLQQLKDETEAHQRLLPELDRLRTQAERAYRLQQEQRLLRAEHQAMKIRYETRVEKMSQEHSKMMTTMESLQKEKASDRELVEGVQKALVLMRDAYTQDQMRWEEEKAKLDKQIKELSETREAVKMLQQRTGQLKEELSQQERCRVDLVNKFTTDRAAWDINKATLQGRINQLEEQVQRSRREAGSSQALETAWSKERAHQQKLLSEAHSLALDLQKQLTSRSQEAEENQRLLVAEMEKERLGWDRERREKEQQLTELESRLQWQGSLQRRVMEIQQYAEREVQQARKERAEMTKRLVDTRQQQARDARAMDEILTGLVRLRELGATLSTEEGKPPPATVGLSDFDRDLLKYIKEALTQITKAADQLTKTDSNGSARIRRSLSSSELELLREELNDLRQEGGDMFPVLDVTVPVTDSSGPRSQQPPQRSSSLEDQASDVTLPPLLLRPLTPSHTLSKTPSYMSGSRSAQGSRATSPDVHHVTDFSPSRKFLETPTSAGSGAHRPSKEMSPHRRSASPKTGPSSDRQPPFSSSHSASASATSGLAISTATSTATTTTTTTSVSSSRASRPRTLTKSLSVDSQPTWMSKPSLPHSYSASTTPTQPGPPPVGASEGEGRSSTLPRRRIGGLSPRTARKKFFEESPPEKAAFLSWPERGKRQERGAEGGAQRSLHVQGVDPREVRRGAEEEHEWLLSRVVEVPPHPPHAMKTSISWHEKMHHKMATSPRAESSPSRGPLSEKGEEGEDEEKQQQQQQKPQAASPSDSQPSKDAGASGAAAAAQGPQSKGKGGQSTAKDRRRLFKKSSSLDSEVGACIAHAGVTTLASPAAPSSFSPSDFLATLKGKLVPAFSRKSKEEPPRTTPLCPPSPLFIPTTVPDIPLRPPPPPSSSSATTTTCTTTTTSTTATIITTTSTTTTSVGHPWSSHLREGTVGGEEGVHSGTTVDPSGEDSRGRGFSRRQGPHPHQRDSRGDARDIRWRSMSADRATRPLMVHTDVIVPAQIWQFSETAV